jgi:hypothetical protein
MAKHGIPEPDFLNELGGRIGSRRTKRAGLKLCSLRLLDSTGVSIAELEGWSRNIFSLNLHAIAKALAGCAGIPTRLTVTLRMDELCHFESVIQNALTKSGQRQESMDSRESELVTG